MSSIGEQLEKQALKDENRSLKVFIVVLSVALFLAIAVAWAGWAS